MGTMGTKRRAIVVAILAAIAATVAGGASIAHAGGARSHGEFVLTETTTGRASFDVDRSGGSSPGDAFIFHSVLTDAAATAVGTVDGHCTTLLDGRGLCPSALHPSHRTPSTPFPAP